MKVLSAIDVSLALLEGILSAVKLTGIAADIAKIEVAIANVLAVQGNPVTYGQLESFHIKPMWP